MSVCVNGFNAGSKIFPKCGFGCVTCLHWHILSFAQSAEVKSPIWQVYSGFLSSFRQTKTRLYFNILIHNIHSLPTFVLTWNTAADFFKHMIYPGANLKWIR